MAQDGPPRSWWQTPLARSGWRPVSPWLGAWHRLFDFNAKPSEVYAAIKAAVAEREIPDVSFSEVTFREAGIFSSGRVYLRLTRENQVFDICAAPYGRGFFVSWHLAEARPSPVWPTLGAVFYPLLLAAFLVEHAGPANGLVYTAALFVAGFFLAGALVAQSAGERWTQYLLVVPFLGRFLERLFLPPTYFRLDSALMFGESVQRALKEAIATIGNTKGCRLPPDVDWKPVMQDLYPR